MRPTEKQIYEALIASEAHHLDGVMCDESNYLKFNRWGEACALCQLFSIDNEETNCKKCPLNDPDCTCCKEWLDVGSARGVKDFTAFHTAELALYKRIRELREEYEEKLKGESKHSKQPKFKQGDSAMFWGEKVEILGLKETGNFAGKYRIRKWGVKHKGFYVCESELLPISSEQLKFTVGDKVWYDSHGESNIDPHTAKVLEYMHDNRTHPWRLDSDGFGDNLHAKESYLSPLPEMYVGRKWVLDQPNNPWDGFEVKCVREDNKHGDYEQCVWTNPKPKTLNSYGYPNKREWRTPRFITNCIDPAFWTGEICGEKVRCYEDKDGKIIIEQKNGHSWHQSSCLMIITENVMLAAIKDANIPIMPFRQSQGKYDPPPEEK